MKFKTIVGLVMGAIASVFMYFGTVLGMGAWKEVSDARKAKKQKAEEPAEEAKTEEKPAEEEKTEE